MPLDEAQSTLEMTGSFWLPGDPNDNFHGVLRITHEHEINLEFEGVFGGFRGFLARSKLLHRFPLLENEPPNLERIVGVLGNAQPITLDGCIPVNQSVNFGGGSSKSLFRAEICFVGAAYSESEEPNFSELNFTIEGLTDWLSLPAIQTQIDTENNSGVIAYHAPENVVVHLHDGIELRFSFNLTVPNPFDDRAAFEARVKQDAVATLLSRDPRSLNYFEQLAFRLCDFLCLALDQAVCIQSMTGVFHQQTEEGPERKKEVKIYGILDPLRERHGSIRRRDALFLYPKVAAQLEEIVNRWFQNYDVLDPAISLYFSSTTQLNQFLDTQVLFLAQALETLHRRRSDETDISADDFTARVDTVIQYVPDDLRKWLRGKLSYANELGLKRRLVRLIEPFERWFGSDVDRRDFVRAVYDTRNYLTHYDESGNQYRADSFSELLELKRKLEALFQLHLLDSIGLDAASIDEIVNNSQRLRGKLR